MTKNLCEFYYDKKEKNYDDFEFQEQFYSIIYQHADFICLKFNLKDSCSKFEIQRKNHGFILNIMKIIYSTDYINKNEGDKDKIVSFSSIMINLDNKEWNTVSKELKVDSLIISFIKKKEFRKPSFYNFDLVIVGYKTEKLNIHELNEKHPIDIKFIAKRLQITDIIVLKEIKQNLSEFDGYNLLGIFSYDEFIELIKVKKIDFPNYDSDYCDEFLTKRNVVTWYEKR